ncbi:RE2 [Symbiodinium natans]|uniref:RE2 protein n=1 Tax=Symbiodinium natans TaxID=878477 RepID=A0A812U5H0_9DINO|nr:RE2 [Symbiodinium natans]
MTTPQAAEEQADGGQAEQSGDARPYQWDRQWGADDWRDRRWYSSWNTAWQGAPWSGWTSSASWWWNGAWGDSDSSDRWQKPDGTESRGKHQQEERRTQAERRESASTAPAEDESDRHPDHVDSVDDGSTGGESRANPKTGKDFVPEYDGKGPMREYQRRVRLFEASTGTTPPTELKSSWSASQDKLGWLLNPCLSRISSIKTELEPLEFLRVFSTLAEFYKNFRREKGQEFVAYDMAFRAQLQRLDEIGGGIDGVTKAYWFLEKAGLSAELRKQVVAAAGGVYDYVKLRSALVAIVPQVHRAEEERSSAAPQVRQWKRGGPTSHPRQVHATLDDGELEEEAQFEDAGEDQGSEDADKLEAELEVLMTQAARKRAQVEKARGFTKNEAPEEREKRIRDMKSRMPCSACKAHGKTVYGHWHSDDACPYKSKGKASGSGKPVLAVVEEDLSDSEEDDFGPGESPIFVTVMEENWCASVGQGKNLYPREHRPIALSDTCCARTVVGEKWMQDHIKYLHNQGEDVFIVDEKRPFRFGGGPRVYSTYAVIFPLQVSGSMKVAFVRASVVQQEVPLLMSKNALKNLGATLDLAAGSLQLTALDASVRLVETASGLCGFEINQNPSERNLEVPPSELLADGCEVMICPDRDRQVHAVRQDRRERDRECEALAEQYLAEKRFRYRDLLHIVRKLPLKERRDHRDIDGRKDEPVTSFLGGLWVHGGFHGIAKTAKRYPAVIQYINAFMQKKHPGGWTSFVLMKNISTKIHKDVNNEVNTMSTTVSFGRFRGGRLWVSLSDGEKPPGGRDIVYMQDDEGNPQRGYGVCTQKTPYTFDPRCAHATCPWEGERWCLTMYTSRGIQHASQMSMLAPKKKEEYVKAIGARCTVKEEDLKQHTVERLKEIWAVLKPTSRKKTLLPSGWRRFDLEGLKELYSSVVVPSLQREHNGHWGRWNRGHLIMQMEMWMDECMENPDEIPEETHPHQTPLCKRCTLPMIERTNRVNGEGFFGCLRFPMCRETLPLLYNGLPTVYVQESMLGEEKKGNKAEAKGRAKEKGLFNPKARVKGPKEVDPALSSNSQGSWVQAGRIPVDEVSSEDESQKPGAERKVNVNLTPQEIQMIEKMRAEKEEATSGNKVVIFDKLRTRGVSESCSEAWQRVFGNMSDSEDHGEHASVPEQSQEPIRTGLSSDGISFDVPAGRCFLVAGEHLREAIGDEKQYGDPEVQKALALFKKVPKEATYEDLLGQADPEPMGDLEDQPIGRDLTEDVEMDISDQAGLPEEYRSMVGYVGWYHDRFMNPVLVSHKTWALRTPEQKYSPESFPYRSTWVRIGGEWKRIEHEVKWSELEDPNAIISGGPASLMVTVFQSRTRRERCLEDVPVALKKPRIESSGSQVHAVMTKGALGKNKLKRMLEKEVPYEKIPEHEKELYRAAEEKEWKSWCDFNSCEILSPEESARVEREKGDRILPSRYVYRNKHAGLLDDQGRPLPVKAKARLCLQGHLCPDSRSGEIQVDSPTIERVSTMIFLHQVISQGWMSDWFIGDISNAFLQGAPLQGKEMFMRQPRQGLKGMLPGQLLKLLKPVYGRPDAPRAWYNELARVLEEELHLQKCVTDQCLFTLRDDQNRVRGLLVIHVDDLMLCHDGSQLGKDTVQKLKARFPFGTWDRVMDQKNGVTYCGKEIRILNDEKGEQVIALSQNGFIDGRVQKLEISRERRAESEQRATEEERSEYRSVVGSLQWLITQTRPDLAFEVNQLQKRIADLRVHDLVRANRAVQEATQHRLEIIFRNLGPDAELVVYHDAGLYSSVGVELDEREADDVLQTGMEKKLIYSQKGAVVGFVQKGATQKKNERVHLNMIDWKSATNRRVVESSFAAETHAALMGHGMARFAQVLVSEVRHGKEIVSALGDEDWQGVVSTTLCIKTVNI